MKKNISVVVFVPNTGHGSNSGGDNCGGSSGRTGSLTLKTMLLFLLDGGRLGALNKALGKKI